MSISSLIASLERIAHEAQTAAPVLTALGVPGLGEIGAILGAATQIADNLQIAIAADASIASTTDKAALDALVVELFGKADGLNAIGNVEVAG